MSQINGLQNCILHICIVIELNYFVRCRYNHPTSMFNESVMSSVFEHLPVFLVPYKSIIFTEDFIFCYLKLFTFIFYEHTTVAHPKLTDEKSK